MPPLIFLPTHGPHLDRSGPPDQFDWRQQCRIAVAYQRAHPGSIVYVPSAFQQSGKPSELEFYSRELHALGLPLDSLRMESKGLDTLEQCDLAVALAERTQSSLIAISCGLHSLRVRYLLRGHNVRHAVARGTANKRLAASHVLLALVFPVIQACRFEPTWRKYVNRRRSEGRQ